MVGQVQVNRPLAALLSQCQEEIAAAWAEKVHRLPGAHYNQHSMGEIQAWGVRAISIAVETLSTGSTEAAEAYLGETSLARLQLEFDIGEVIEGQFLLRDAAWAVIVHGFAPGVAPSTADLTDLDAYLRFMVGRFGQLYAELMTRRLVEQQSRTTMTIASLQRVTTALLEETSLPGVLKTVLHEACKLSAASAGALFFWDGGPWLEVAQSEGELSTLSGRVPVDGTFAGSVVLSGEPLIITGADEMRRSPYLDSPIESLLAIPLRRANSVVGALDVVNKPGGFSQEDQWTLSLYADGAAIAIETARLRDRAEQLSIVEERQRLARELHDSVAQALYSVTLYAEAARLAMSAGKEDTAASSLQKLQQMAREAMIDMRMLIFELHPPVLEEEGLAAALQARLASVEGRAGLHTALTVEAEGRPPLRVEEELFRIAVEALNNVVRHAQAREVTVNLWCNGQAAGLEVVDDGRGFDPATAREPGGMGLRGMEERARRIGGTLEVVSARGRGTRIRVEVAS